MKSSTEKSSEDTPGVSVEGGTAHTGKNGIPESSNGDVQINELRRLIVGSEEVSEVLPDAVARSSGKGSRLSDATLPIVEENIRESVLRNPRVLADALFPVIGPAIRKAISAALSSMVQSFNQTLEHSVSPKGLRWRLEAMRTGRSFGEVVMLKTLLYRVEQVFLIHRETGLLLEHVSQNPQDTEDGDMVSAMLTAITDFAHDSFKTDEDATLDSFKISGLNIWIESSPDGILAAVIRGNPPLELRETFSLAIEKLQFSFEREFDSFSGDADIFAGARPELQKCLLYQAEEAKQAGFISPTNVALGVLGLILLIFVGYFGLDYWRWSGLLETVRNEPGYVLTDYERGWFTHTVSGLRDPLSKNYLEFLSPNGYDENDVRFNWREFQDSDPRFVIERARRLLKPPAGTKLKLENGVLLAEGVAPAQWFGDAERIAPMIPGVTSFKVSGGATLIAAVDNAKLLFVCGTVDYLNAGSVKEVIENFPKLARFGEFSVDLVGHADKTGTPGVNETISMKRAVKVRDDISKAFSADESVKLKLNAVSSPQTSDECKVTFKVQSLKR